MPRGGYRIPDTAGCMAIEQNGRWFLMNGWERVVIAMSAMNAPGAAGQGGDNYGLTRPGVGVLLRLYGGPGVATRSGAPAPGIRNAFRMP